MSPVFLPVAQVWQKRKIDSKGKKGVRVGGGTSKGVGAVVCVERMLKERFSQSIPDHMPAARIACGRRHCC